MNTLHKLTACEVVALLRSGEVSIADTLRALQHRIDSVDSKVNALPTLCFERAFTKAEKLQALPLEQRGSLCGIPVSIKDLTEVAGVPTTFGSRIYESNVPEASDDLVLRIEKNGGLVYAKSNTPEFGAGGITFNDVYGITRNPHDTRLASGGSSGGAAASLASGCSWLSQGSDMAGSLRTPAAFCGIASLRPSPGSIRASSAFLPFDVLSADGPMARNIDDLALLADSMRAEGTNRLVDAVKNPRAPGKVAYSQDLGVTEVDGDIETAFHSFVEQLAKLSVGVRQAEPDFADVHSVFDVLRANVYAIGCEEILARHPGIMKPELEWNINYGLALSAEEIREAVREQGGLINRAADFMEEVDVLVCPATSVVSVDANLRYPGANSGANQGVPVSEYYRWLAIAYASTMTTLPIITMYSGQTVGGLPVGVQLIGKPYGEEALFQYAKAIETDIGVFALPVDPL